MRSHRTALAVFVLTFVHVPVLRVHAAEQPPAAADSLSGTVKDSSGHLLAGVRVRVETRAGEVVARGQSDSHGHFTIVGVVPGEYTVVATKETFQAATADVALAAEKEAGVLLTMEPQVPEDIVVVAKRLDRARNDVYTKTGGSVYHFDEEAIQELPLGQNTPLNQVILQAPGTSQDSFGQLHIRGDHANIQYRLNGVQLPEGINGFSQTLSPRFASKIDLLTGALPAQYGFRTAGIIDIQTKNGFGNGGGTLDLFGGQRGTFTPTLEVGGAQGRFSYYGTGSYFRSNRFIEPPTPGPTPTNGDTNQGKGFGYLSYLLDQDTRLSFLSGTAVTDFGIPAANGVAPAFQLQGVPNFASIDVRESQREENYYNVLALQGTALQSVLDYQVAAFSRYSRLAFSPDQQGDLIFNGVASKVTRSSFTNGLQADTGYKLTDTHTLRGGFFFHGNGASVKNLASVFPADASGAQTSTVPFQIRDNTQVTEWLYGMYLQDEWRPLKGLTLNYGARLDRATAFNNTSQLSPRVGAIYQPTDDTVFHAGYSRYFTPPPPELVSVTDIKKFQGTTNQVSSNVNTSVTPDRSHYFDVGASHQLIPGLNLGVDGYYKKSLHLLDEGQFGQALVISPFNYRKGTVFGAEGTASYTYDAFTGYMNFAYSKAQGKQVVSAQFNFDPDELAFIDKHYVHLDHDQTYTASGGVAYRFKGYQASVTTIAGSGLRNGFANTDHLPYYIQTDLGLEKAVNIPHVGEVKFRTSVVNVFDQTYLIRDGSGIGVQSAQYGPRRAFYCGVTLPLPFTAAPQTTVQ